MRLADIMGNAGLSWYAEVALIMFVVAFVAIGIWVFLPSRRAAMDAASRLPLERDGSGTSTGEGVMR